jgi:hypothetical protein
VCKLGQGPGQQWRGSHAGRQELFVMLIRAAADAYAVQPLRSLQKTCATERLVDVALLLGAQQLRDVARVLQR